MKPTDFGMPGSFSDRSYAGSDPIDWDAEGTNAVLDDQLDEMADSMLVLLYNLPDVDKVRVFLDAYRSSKMGRHRKNLCRDLARAASRLDKDVFGLSDEDKAKLFCRSLVKLEGRMASIVIAGAISDCYIPIAQRLMALLNVDAPAEKVLQVFQSVRQGIPDLLWPSVLLMVEKDNRLQPRQRLAIRTICQQFPDLKAMFTLPFAVNGVPELIPLERHLLDLHAKDPAAAKPLIAGLAQLNPSRAENWFLFGLTGAVEGQPQGISERAWQLASQFYRWGDDFATVDKPFDAERVQSNVDAIRAIFTDGKLAAARKLVGDYILRQLVQMREFTLAVELFSPELVRAHQALLAPVVMLVANMGAKAKDVEAISALAARFPEVRAMGVLAKTLRRAGQLEAAAVELRSAKLEPPGERLLLDAKITDAFELFIPEDPKEQENLSKRLQLAHECLEDTHPEISYCRALVDIMRKDTNSAQEAYFTLLELPDVHLGVRAYRFLAALLAQEPEVLLDEVREIRDADAEDVLAFLPTNLLKTGIRSLALVADSGEDFSAMTQFFYEHTPEMLDTLLGHEELLASNPALLARLLDNTDKLPDPIQRWAGYQRVMQLAGKMKQTDLVARAIDGCLDIKEALLAPFQAKLLQEQITACEDSDLKEELVERFIPLNPEQAKAYLYQLLHEYLGNDRREDAWRMVEALRELKENSADLDRCIGVLQPYFASAAKSTGVDGKLLRPVSVGFYGGDPNDKVRTEQLRDELMRKHSGLTLEFEHNAWNMKNRSSLVNSVDKFDVVCASNLMRTDISRGLRRRAREQGKTFGFCRNRGLGTISETILKAVQMHLARKK